MVLGYGDFSRVLLRFLGKWKMGSKNKGRRYKNRVFLRGFRTIFRGKNKGFGTIKKPNIFK